MREARYKQCDIKYLLSHALKSEMATFETISSYIDDYGAIIVNNACLDANNTLQIALTNQHATCTIELLLNNGAEIINGTRNNTLDQALYWRNSPDTIKLLLDRGAKPDIVSLRTAIERELSFATIKLLLDYDPTIIYNNKYSSCNILSFAVENKCPVEIISLLLEYGAEITNPLNSPSHHILSKAQQYGASQEVIDLLLRNKAANESIQIDDIKISSLSSTSSLSI